MNTAQFILMVGYRARDAVPFGGLTTQLVLKLAYFPFVLRLLIRQTHGDGDTVTLIAGRAPDGRVRDFGDLVRDALKRACLSGDFTFRHGDSLIEPKQLSLLLADHVFDVSEICDELLARLQPSIIRHPVSSMDISV